MADLVFSFQELMKILPGLALFPLSFYLAWKKIGNRLSVSYSVHVGRTSARRIGSINITNMKDKPVTIYSIYAVFCKDVCLPVEEFDTPLVLKALESVRVETTPYSFALLGTEEFEPDYLAHMDMDIYLCTDSGVVKGRKERAPRTAFEEPLNRFRVAGIHTMRFNDVVYNKNCRYAITYLFDSKQHTAIIDDAGFIAHGWGFKYNMIPKSHMRSPEAVTAYLKTCGYDKLFQYFTVDELRQPNTSAHIVDAEEAEEA